MDLIAEYEQIKLKYEQHLRYAETPGFRLVQFTESGGEVDVTQQQIQRPRCGC